MGLRYTQRTMHEDVTQSAFRVLVYVVAWSTELIVLDTDLHIEPRLML